MITITLVSAVIALMSATKLSRTTKPRCGQAGPNASGLCEYRFFANQAMGAIAWQIL